MTTSDHEWPRMTSDHGWPRVTTSHHERPQVTTAEITSKNVSDVIMTSLRSHCEVIASNNDLTSDQTQAIYLCGNQSWMPVRSQFDFREVGLNLSNYKLCKELWTSRRSISLRFVSETERSISERKNMINICWENKVSASRPTRQRVAKKFYLAFVFV